MNTLPASPALPPSACAPRTGVGVALRAASPDAEVFVPPSVEAVRLLRWLPSLVSPPVGLGPWHARAMRDFLVAPFTQLTFMSFDLQVFLFDVLHTSVVSRVGHLLGMCAATLFWIALAAELAGGAWGAGLAAAVLVVWYGAVARSRGLWAWWAVMVPVVATLGFGGGWLAEAASPLLLLAGLVGSSTAIAFSHAFEPLFPPRAGHPHRWIPPSEYLLGPPSARRGAVEVASRGVRMLSYALFVGVLDELWASPRLLPYNVLRLMFAAGYAPALKRVLDDRAARALASGNPALDYVGIGGGTFLAASDA